MPYLYYLIINVPPGEAIVQSRAKTFWRQRKVLHFGACLHICACSSSVWEVVLRTHRCEVKRERGCGAHSQAPPTR